MMLLPLHHKFCKQGKLHHFQKWMQQIQGNIFSNCKKYYHNNSNNNNNNLLLGVESTSALRISLLKRASQVDTNSLYVEAVRWLSTAASNK